MALEREVVLLTIKCVCVCVYEGVGDLSKRIKKDTYFSFFY